MSWADDFVCWGKEQEILRLYLSWLSYILKGLLYYCKIYNVSRQWSKSVRLRVFLYIFVITKHVCWAICWSSFCSVTAFWVYILFEKLQFIDIVIKCSYWCLFPLCSWSSSSFLVTCSTSYLCEMLVDFFCAVSFVAVHISMSWYYFTVWWLVLINGHCGSSSSLRVVP